MDDFETILRRVPANKRDTVLAWWNALPEAHHDQGLRDLAAKYPGLPAPPTVGAQTVVQGQRPVRLGAAQSLMAGAGQGLTLGGIDELAGVSSRLHGEPYAPARELAAASLEQAKAEHPILFHAGELGGGLIGILGGEPAVRGIAEASGLPAVAKFLTPTVTRGLSGSVARGLGEGALLGGVSGALNASPGSRTTGALVGSTLGAASGTVGGLGGGLFGRFAGNPEARMARGIAEAGNVDLRTAMRQAADISPDAPVAAADLLGPTAVAKVRSAAITPGPGQAIVRDFFRTREAQAPQRIVGTIEDMTGATGLNRYAAAEQLAQARSAEADRLYTAAYAERPTPELAQTAKVPRVAQAVQRLRNERRASGLEVSKGPATVEELHSVRKLLDAQSQSLGNPNASSADRAAAYVAGTLRDRLDAGLKSVPGFATADNAFREASGLMAHYSPTEAGQVGGTNFLQADPALAEHMLATATPDERRMVLLGLPASVAREANTASPRTLVSRLGLGATPKYGRKVALEALTEHFPDAENRLGQLASQEELMVPANRAAGAEVAGSSTVPNLLSLAEQSASNVVYPTVRGELFGLVRNGLRGMAKRSVPTAEEARLLTTSGNRLRWLLSDAELSQTDRDARRILGRQVGAAVTPGLVGFGVNDDQGRQVAASTYYNDLRTQGATEDAARQLAQTRYGVTLP